MTTLRAIAGFVTVLAVLALACLFFVVFAALFAAAYWLACGVAFWLPRRGSAARGILHPAGQDGLRGGEEPRQITFANDATSHERGDQHLVDVEQQLEHLRDMRALASPRLISRQRMELRHVDRR